MIDKLINDIENRLEALKKENNAVTKDLSEDVILSAFKNLVYYGMYEKLLEGEKYSKEELQKMYEIFVEDEEYEKCQFISKLL